MDTRRIFNKIEYSRKYLKFVKSNKKLFISILKDFVQNYMEIKFKSIEIKNKIINLIIRIITPLVYKRFLNKKYIDTWELEGVYYTCKCILMYDKNFILFLNDD